jgi:predicted dehydrogenase
MADHGLRTGDGVATVAATSPQDQPGDHSMRDTSNLARRPTRRQFVKCLAGTAVGAIAAPAIVRGRNLNDKLSIAMIATGGRGGFNLKQAAIASENIVVLCDVHEPAVDKAAQMYPQARRYSDFRRVYDRANDFDAVVVSTTEHTHAFATLPALQLGKHVYCEKPLTYNIWEARVIREAAAKTKVATQMGNQNHSNDNYRRVVELIQTGAIGPVREAHVWVSRAWGRQPLEAAKKNESYGVLASEKPTEIDSVPTGLDWELWLGPAPARPYNDVYWPGPKWYRWWDFGNGTMSDLGSHMNDLPFWALKLRAPRTVEAFGPPPHREIAPASMHVTYEYGPRGDLPPVKLTWYQGEDKPDLYRDGTIPSSFKDGILFVGSNGMLLASHGKHVLLPEDRFRDFKRPEPTIPNSPGHWAEWVGAAKTGSPTGSNFEYAGWMTEANHLGNVAYRVGRKIEWDPETLSAPNAAEAQPFIRREYRKGWTLA